MGTPRNQDSPPVSVVIGASRGIGRACLRHFAGRGDRVHGVARGELGASGVHGVLGVRGHRADAMEEGELTAVLDSIVETEGRLDHVVLTVGDLRSGRLDSQGVEDLDLLYRSNLRSAQVLMGASRSHLRSAGGSAVFLGCAGLGGLAARREIAAYAAMKSALLVLVRSWAVEEARFGVRVNLVSPGLIPHPDAEPETLDPAAVRRIPMARPGKPEEVAAAVAWLCSSEASYTTGADLPVSGGWRV